MDTNNNIISNTTVVLPSYGSSPEEVPLIEENNQSSSSSLWDQLKERSMAVWNNATAYARTTESAARTYALDSLTNFVYGSTPSQENLQSQLSTSDSSSTLSTRSTVLSQDSDAQVQSQLSTSDSSSTLSTRATILSQDPDAQVLKLSDKFARLFSMKAIDRSFIGGSPEAYEKVYQDALSGNKTESETRKEFFKHLDEANLFFLTRWIAKVAYRVLFAISKASFNHVAPSLYGDVKKYLHENLSVNKLDGHITTAGSFVNLQKDAFKNIEEKIRELRESDNRKVEKQVEEIRKRVESSQVVDEGAATDGNESPEKLKEREAEAAYRQALDSIQKTKEIRAKEAEKIGTEAWATLRKDLEPFADKSGSGAPPTVEEDKRIKSINKAFWTKMEEASKLTTEAQLRDALATLRKTLAKDLTPEVEALHKAELEKPEYHNGLSPSEFYAKIVHQLIKKYSFSISLGKFLYNRVTNLTIANPLQEALAGNAVGRVVSKVITIALYAIAFFIKALLFIPVALLRVLLALPEQGLNKLLWKHIEKSIIEEKGPELLLEQVMTAIRKGEGQEGLSASLLQTLNITLQESLDQPLSEEIPAWLNEGNRRGQLKTHVLSLMEAGESYAATEQLKHPPEEQSVGSSFTQWIASTIDSQLKNGLEADVLAAGFINQLLNHEFIKQKLHTALETLNESFDNPVTPPDHAELEREFSALLTQVVSRAVNNSLSKNHRIQEQAECTDTITNRIVDFVNHTIKAASSPLFIRAAYNKALNGFLS